MQVNVGGGVKATINITPLADVCLVLLIVFMMMTAMIRQGVSVKLPRSSGKAVFSPFCSYSAIEKRRKSLSLAEAFQSIRRSPW